MLTATRSPAGAGRHIRSAPSLEQLEDARDAAFQRWQWVEDMAQLSVDPRRPGDEFPPIIQAAIDRAFENYQVALETTTERMGREARRAGRRAG